MQNISKKQVRPVILFIPEAGIYSFLRGLSVLGDAIVKEGGKVYVTHDSGQMLRSPLISKHRLKADAPESERIRISKANLRNLKKVKRKYGFSIIELSDFVDEKLLGEINSLTKDPTIDLEEIIYKGFPVGKIAQYDFILESKFPYSKDLSSEHRALYSEYVRNTALAQEISDRIAKKHNPSLFITFNEYAECQAVRFSAEKNNVKRMAMTYPTHYNIDASRFYIWETTCEFWRYVHCQKWHEIKEIPVATKSVEECFNDSIFRMYSTGSHIFSHQKKEEPGDISKKLELDPSKKTLVVFPSSQDERTSVEVAMKIWKENNNLIDAFPDQITWLIALKKYSETRNDIQIVVRIHPREGSRQFGFESAHMKKLKEAFQSNTPSFIILWPDDPISSYDLMELADACLVSWSLTGQEAARLGIPVLSYVGNMFYPDDDFMQVGTTPSEYISKLNSIIDLKYSWHHLVRAIRFYHWRTFIPSLDLGETVPVTTTDDNVWPEASSEMIPVINNILKGKVDLIEYNKKKWKEGLNSKSEEEEVQAIKKGIRLFIDKVFYAGEPIINKKRSYFTKQINRIKHKIFNSWHTFFPKKMYAMGHPEFPFHDYQLEYTEDLEHLEDFLRKTSENSNVRVILKDGLCALLLHNGIILKRKSPMVLRLAKLHEKNFRE